MFVLLSLVGAPGRGGKMIPEFQRSLLDGNNENCPHVEKNSDVITGKSGNQTKKKKKKNLTGLKFHLYLK